MSETVIGKIHSVESFGAVDGPGVRFIFFMQGCHMRCLYCHNPDSWEVSNGKLQLTPQEALERVLTYKSFISKGGVTLSGGEPLLQPEFCYELTKLCHKENIHVAIDTSGTLPLEKTSKAILEADLILLDIKEIDADDAKILTGLSNYMAYETLKFCEKNNKKVWVRHVILPEYTLKKDKLERLADSLIGYDCIERVELLPYHVMGSYKWEELGLDYKLTGIDPPSQLEIDEAREIFAKRGLAIK